MSGRAGKATRAKGRRGQQECANLLRDRDWVVSELNAGKQGEDYIAQDPDGKTWSVEVKNTVDIQRAHRRQAMKQAERSKLPWMLCSKIAGTSDWLIQRQGMRCVVWSVHHAC